MLNRIAGRINAVARLDRWRGTTALDIDALKAAGIDLPTAAKMSFHFKCNVCGAVARCKGADISREADSCSSCHSSVRMRAIVHLVSVALFGKSLALPDFPRRPDLRGVGLSDWDVYARGFASKLSYTNTYYHQEPLLDITRVPDSMAGTCDFLVSSDVFEHVTPPVSAAFEGAFRLLKPGGTLVLTVPFATDQAETREHFPLLHHFELLSRSDKSLFLRNTRTDGVVEEFENHVFHRGPGSTLEMRMFSRDALQAELERAGFVDIRFTDEHVSQFGIFWAHPWSVPIVARRPA